MNKNKIYHIPLLPLGEGKKRKCNCFKPTLDEGIRFLIILFLNLSFLICHLSFAFAHTPQEIINNLNKHFNQIKDANAEIALDTSLQILGCGGVNRQKGYGWFKAPDKIKAVLGNDTYLIKGNQIRWIDAKGKNFRIRLVNAPDFSCGFNANLIPHNFNLKIIKDDDKEIILEGLPKPGVLKNVNKILFYFDPTNYLLRQMALRFNNAGFSGKIYINYEKINGIWVPVATHGKSALEILSGTLAAFNFNLGGKNIKINSGISNIEIENR